jgi:cytosine/adenosine deaminase-related metal-dependent hydrolase
MLLIQNAHIKTMAGADIPNGCLLIEDGKIAAVAPEIDAPVGAKVIDAQGRLLTPGWRHTATSALTINPCVGKAWTITRSLIR